MPGEIQNSSSPNLNNQHEKVTHYSYLKDFRVEPCPLFKQHQCLQHRPYTCFYYHFKNQQRRRPVRKKDFTFNYSADIYCTKYDENLGVCPDGDDCPYLHRVYGDVERKYHLRYYKTALCVHSVDSKGHCVKNGVHCAFAHGPDDLRNPIFDIRELQNPEVNGENLERERLNFVVEDPIWQDQDYVLLNYKTELCKKPPRLCRQGYACPYYHNGKDKRRCAQLIKYRSTPCPSVKHGDEWGDPETCEQGDNCTYCHTRTEQQFHPEIYKSTKCNDMQQHGYCPRGPFCAFAHTEAEMHTERQPIAKELVKKTSNVNSPLVSILTNSNNGHGSGHVTKKCPDSPSSPCSVGVERGKRVSVDSVPSAICPLTAGSLPAIGHHQRASIDDYLFNVCAAAASAMTPSSLMTPPSSSSVVTLSSSSLMQQQNSLEAVINGPPLSSVFNQQQQPTQPLASDTTGSIQQQQGGQSVPTYSSVLKQRHHSESSTKCLKSIWSSLGDVLNENGAAGGAGDLNSASPGYSKAPGFEREQQSPTKVWSTDSTNSNIVGGVKDTKGNSNNAALCKLKANLYLSHEIGCDVVPPFTTPPVTPGSLRGSTGGSSSSFSPFAASAASTNCANIWQVGGHLNDRNHLEDLTLEDLPPISERDERVVESLASSLSRYTTSPGYYGSSAPVTIPGAESGFAANNASNSCYSASPMSHGSAVGSGGLFFPSGDNQTFKMSGSFGHSFMSECSSGLSEPENGLQNAVLCTEINKLREERDKFKARCSLLERYIQQNVPTWKQLYEQLKQERSQVIQERDTALNQLNLLQAELQRWQLNSIPPLNNELLLTPAQLEQAQTRLRNELNKVERCMQKRATGPICGRCGSQGNNATTSGGCPVCSPNSKQSTNLNGLMTS